MHALHALKSYFAPVKRNGKPTPQASEKPKSAESSIKGKSQLSSRPMSSYPTGDFRNNSDSLMDVKADVMVNWLYQAQLERLWTNGLPGEGVVLKKSRGNYTACPEKLMQEHDGFFDAIMFLNVKCGMTISTRTIQLLLGGPTSDFVPLPNGLRLQVLPSIAHLPRCQKHHFAAFIRDQKMLVVWDDEPRLCLERAERIQELLMRMIWDDQTEVEDEKKSPGVSTIELGSDDLSASDLEEALVTERRPTLLINPVMVGLSMGLMVAIFGLGWQSLAVEVAMDHSYTRLALLVCTIPQMFIAMFFMLVVVSDIAQIVGPISQMNMNSKYFSAKAPRRLNRNVVDLPHVTIQMPVYKEGLAAVIGPTVHSLKMAISTYELQGGTANIFVNDDGMQLIPEEEAQIRRDFYEEHNIGWVARPAHNPNPQDGTAAFVRKGKFKKASNMNYALNVSNRVEDKLLAVRRHAAWNQDHEAQAYAQCLGDVMTEDEGRTWANGNVRIGDYILLVDSDTRVPVDCLLDACSEMEQSPNVGILQYSCGVMQVTNSFFENGITFFTNLIYTAIRYAIANGDVSPFVGHNAVLRWNAVQEVAYVDEDGYEKFWSESHVSEDFDMALRLSVNGFLIRLAAYAGDGFKEGVSLTVYDELARWEKYAYGCNEMLFNPFRFWFTRGPFTKLFRTFMMSNMRFTYKITTLAYIGTYYAIGAIWPLTLANYFLTGWYIDYLDQYYLDSFKVYFSVVVVFNGVGNVALAVLRYRLSEKSLPAALYENFKWLFLLAIFFSGISLHVSQALLCHFFEIDMSWGATSKEVENTTFFQEMPKLLRKFKWTFIFCFACTALMICGVYAFPVFWRITTLSSIYPLATVVVGHFLLPVALNPALMMFSW